MGFFRHCGALTFKRDEASAHICFTTWPDATCARVVCVCVRACVCASPPAARASYSSRRTPPNRRLRGPVPCVSTLDMPCSCCAHAVLWCRAGLPSTMYMSRSCSTWRGAGGGGKGKYMLTTAGGGGAKGVWWGARTAKAIFSRSSAASMLSWRGVAAVPGWGRGGKGKSGSMSGRGGPRGGTVYRIEELGRLAPVSVGSGQWNVPWAPVVETLQ